jgi:hypothetical protein
VNKSTATAKLEKRIVRAALACLDRNGFMFQTNHAGSYVIKPDAMRRLESSCVLLKHARTR